ncbi:hypothetical protein BG003_001151 [Podila horticola]|nr:hypothetical protein BG003_001151 [Podila horticola]
MSDKLTSSDSFADFFVSLHSFYTSRERLAAEAAGTRASETAEAIVTREDSDDVLLDPPPEAHTLEEKHTAPFIRTADLLQLEQRDIEYLTQKPVAQIEGCAAELLTKDTTRYSAEHDDQSQRVQCDFEHSTEKLFTQFEGNMAELSTTKGTAWYTAEHYETGGKFEDGPVSITQQSSLLALPPLLQSKWANPSTPETASRLINMNSSQNNRQGRSQPTGLESRAAIYARVTTTSLKASMWAISKSAEQGGAVKPTDQGNTMSSSSKGTASSGLNLSGKDSGKCILEKPRQRYSREFLLTFSKYRKSPPNIYWIVSTIRDNITKPKVIVAKFPAPNATVKDGNRNKNDSVPTAGTPSAKTESAHPVAHPVAVRPSPSSTKSSPNVQQSRASGSGGLSGKVFSLPKARDPKGASN